MLLECAEHLKDTGKDHRTLKLYGQEKNLTSSSIARMNMFLHGIEEFEIARGDTLRNPAFFEANGLKRFDCVIANPPFSLQDWGAENWANDPYGRNIAAVPPKSNGDMAWVQHMVKSMNTLGRMVVVLPHGALFRKGVESNIREALIREDLLEAVIGLGQNIFYGASLAACVMVFRKQKVDVRKGRVLFIDGADQIRVGRAQNYLESKHINQIYDWYLKFEDVQNYVRVATLNTLEQNNFNLNIASYVEKINEDNLPSLQEALATLNQTWNLSLDSENEFKNILQKFIK
jgi:type I restriction enzyme M protein